MADFYTGACGHVHAYSKRNIYAYCYPDQHA